MKRISKDEEVSRSHFLYTLDFVVSIVIKREKKKNREQLIIK